jgi:hypothetical protein
MRQWAMSPLLPEHEWFIAAQKGEVDRLRSLAAAHPHLLAVTDKGRTALHRASAFGQVVTVDTLLGLGLGVDVRDKEGLSALDHACCHHHLPVVRLLLDRGATPAERHRDPALFCWLVTEGFDPDDTSVGGVSPRACLDEDARVAVTAWEEQRRLSAMLAQEQVLPVAPVRKRL